MKYPIYLRPLHPDDAKVSYRWRNIPEVWIYTMRTHTTVATEESEREWLIKVLARKDQKRFAICLKETDQYVGNVQLLDITREKATFHIFIGEKELWGKGIAKKATSALMKYAFRKRNLQTVTLQVHVDNAAAIAAYKKTGFTTISQKENFLDMELTKKQFENHLLTVPVKAD